MATNMGIEGVEEVQVVEDGVNAGHKLSVITNSPRIPKCYKVPSTTKTDANVKKLAPILVTGFTMPASISAPARSFICSSCRAAHRSIFQRRHASTSKTPAIYDVVAVGGGPVGLALLAALSTSTRIATILLRYLISPQNHRL